LPTLHAPLKRMRRGPRQSLSRLQALVRRVARGLPRALRAAAGI